MNPPPLFLLPGMGADERMFAPLAARLPRVRVPKWIEPWRRELLPDYAARMAQAVDPGEPCFIGGCSFGGMVAVEMSHHLPGLLGCFLMASCRTPDQIAARGRAGRLLLRLMPLTLTRPAQWLLRLAAPLGGAVYGSGMRQLAASNRKFYRWAAFAIATWKATPPPADSPPVFQIHGGSDRIIPCRGVRPDLVIEGAGHLLPMTHPDAVAEFIRTKMAENPSPSQGEGGLQAG